jgi:transposase
LKRPLANRTFLLYSFFTVLTKLFLNFYIIPLLDHIEIDGSKVLADRGYDSNQLIDYIYDHGGEPTIPSRRGAKFERRCDWWFYKERHLVENYFLKLKAFRRIATRYDKLAFTYLGFLCIVSILIWLK